MVTVTTSIGITTESCGMLHHLFATNIADERGLRRHQKERTGSSWNEHTGKGQPESRKGGCPREVSAGREVEAGREGSRNNPGNQRSGAGREYEDTDDANGHQHGQRDHSSADIRLSSTADCNSRPPGAG